MPDPADQPAKPDRLARYRAIIRDIKAGNTDLQALAVKHGYSQLEMARFRNKPRHARMLRDVAALIRDGADLVLNHGRASAARSITSIASDTSHAETSRKASAELIRHHAHQSPRPAATPSPPAPDQHPTTPRPTPAEIQRASDDLERRAAAHFSQSP